MKDTKGSIVVQIIQHNKTPVFRVTHKTWGIDFSSIFGATTLPGNAGVWFYPAYYPLFDLVLKDMRAVANHHRVDLDLTESVTKYLRQVEKIPERIQNKVLPSGFEFKTQPYAHQMEGLVHLIYNIRAGLFYDCGLGKTKIIIDWQRATKSWPIIICPRIAVHVWAKELKIHGIDQEYQPIDAKTAKGKSAQISSAKNYHGMIVTYDVVRRYYEEIADQVPFDAIVADESQKIKQIRSQRTKAALALSKGAFRRVVMSGTPSLGDPRDVYPQYRFLAEYLMPWNPFKFKNMFCKTAPNNKRIVVGFKNLGILNKRVNLVSLRRRKELCLDLPERTFVDIPVEHTAPQKKVYNQLIRASKMTDKDVQQLVTSLVGSTHRAVRTQGSGVVKIPHAAALINKLLQVSCGFLLKEEERNVDPCDACPYLKSCVNAEPPVRPWTPRCRRDVQDVERVDGSVVKGIGEPPERIIEHIKGAKADALVSLLDELLEDPEHKVIIWGQYTEELNIVETLLQKNSWEYVRMDGSNTDRATELETTFETDTSCRVWLGQVATGVSITLNSSRYTVYYSLPWNLEYYLQSLDRNHRLGQSENVTVYRLLSPGVDEHIAKALSLKEIVADALVSTEAGGADDVTRHVTHVREL